MLPNGCVFMALLSLLNGQDCFSFLFTNFLFTERIKTFYSIFSSFAKFSKKYYQMMPIAYVKKLLSSQCQEHPYNWAPVINGFFFQNQLGHQLISINFHHWSRISTLFWSNPVISKRFWPLLIATSHWKFNFWKFSKLS